MTNNQITKDIFNQTFDPISQKIDSISIWKKNWDECKEFININKETFKKLMDKSNEQNIEYALLFPKNNYEFKECSGEECEIIIEKVDYYAIFHTHPQMGNWTGGLLSYHDINFGANNTNIFAVGSKYTQYDTDFYDINTYKLNKERFNKEKQSLINVSIELDKAKLLLSKAEKTKDESTINYHYNIYKSVLNTYLETIINYTNNDKCYTTSYSKFNP